VAEFDDVLRRQDEIIDRVGWAVTMVLPAEDDPGAQFAYTVGLTVSFTDRASVGIGTDLGKRVLNASVTWRLALRRERRGYRDTSAGHPNGASPGQANYGLWRTV